MDNFYNRLSHYLESVAKVLQGNAEAASVFPNPSDRGSLRENEYASFLKSHLPSSCSTILGGYLFNSGGDESKQMDLIVISNLCPRFDFLNDKGTGKSFASIDGAIAIVSVKSFLDSKELIDALDNIASLPSKKDIAELINPSLIVEGFNDWPFKIIYAHSGISLVNAEATVNSYYENHPDIPDNKRVNLIHVAGKYYARKHEGIRVNLKGSKIPTSSFVFQENNKPDVDALAFAMLNIQKIALFSQHVLYTYDDLFKNIIDSNN